MAEPISARAFHALRRTFHDPSSRAHRVVEISVAVLIVISIALTAFELSADIDDDTAQWLMAVDRAILAIFAVEIILRIATFVPPAVNLFDLSPARRWRAHLYGRLRYCAQPLTLIDLLTVVALHPALRGLRALRVFRLIRGVRVFRYTNPFQLIGSAFQDNALLFYFAFTVLGFETVVGGITMYLIEGGRNPAVSSVWDGMWWTLVTLTTVGYGDITPVDGLGRAWAGVLMVAGMFTLALFAGVVGHTMLHTVLTIREEQFRMSRYAEHIVVVGYDTGSRMLIDAMLEELFDIEREVVLFGRGERPADVPPEVRWVSGDPAKESEFDKVHLSHAHTLMFVADRKLVPQQADAATVLGIFTARAYLRHHADALPRKRPLHIVAEILEPENVDHARIAGADEVIPSSRIGFALLAHTIAQPGTAELMGRVVSAGAHSVFVTGAGVLEGLPFQRVARTLKATHSALLIGLREQDGTDILNPVATRIVAPGEQLVYLATGPLKPLTDRRLRDAVNSDTPTTPPTA